MAFTDTEFDVGGASFRIRKLLAMDAYQTLEIIRPSLAALDIGEGEGSGAITRIVGGLPPSVVEEARQRLFAGIQFQKPPQITIWTRLAGQEETAFMDAEPIAVYEVLARAMAVNFMPSWDALQSLLGQADVAENGQYSPG